MKASTEPSGRPCGSSLKCAQLSPEDKLYVSQISARIVRMFQRYAQSIEPESEYFLTFIFQYLAERNVKNPEINSLLGTVQAYQRRNS